MNYSQKLDIIFVSASCANYAHGLALNELAFHDNKRKCDAYFKMASFLINKKVSAIGGNKEDQHIVETMFPKIEQTLKTRFQKTKLFLKHFNNG